LEREREEVLKQIRTMRRKQMSSQTDNNDEGRWSADAILKGGRAPEEADWWYFLEEDTNSMTSTPSEEDNSNSEACVTDQNKQMFRNCGYEAWELRRRAWLTHEQNNGSQIEKNVEKYHTPHYRDIVPGLTHMTRNYEFPYKVKLDDMVKVINDVWECEADY